MARKKSSNTSKTDTVLRYINKGAKRLFWRAPARLGSVLGLYCMVLSLTPSLMPRTWLFQGIVSGLSLISGYGIGVLLAWAWGYMQLPKPSAKHAKIATFATVGVTTVLLIWILTRVGAWQNRLRDLVGVEPTITTNPFRIILIAISLAVILLAIARIVHIINDRIIRMCSRFIPKRFAVVVGIGISLWFFGSVVSGAFASNFLRVANNTFSLADRGTIDGAMQPTDNLTSGGPGSLIAWDDLGRQGRRFAGTGPSQTDIQQIWLDTPAMQPIRAYAGLASGDTHEQRAELVLQELIRTKAFERETLLLATTTGTGYLDPNAVDSFEYVNKGNTAIAAMQYSYLPSWLALLSDTETAKDAGIALFNSVHGYWSTLDEETRPELYLHGLSLGAYGSQASISRVELLNDPVDGALWAGPPFVSEFWNRVTDNRDEGSPAWLPTYNEGQVIRFTDGESGLDLPSSNWNDNKIIYLQYPSDPVVFYSTDYIFEKPEWLQGDKGRGVTPDMRWYPFITFWQLSFDLANAGSTAEGFGHLYSTEDYLESWQALLGTTISSTQLEQITTAID